MANDLAGVRADHRFSYRTLERIANLIREHLKYGPDEPIDTLRLFEDLHEISIKLSDGSVIPFRGGVIALQDSEGYTRYDRGGNVIETLASEETYYRLEAGHARAGYFVAHELGHCVLHPDQLVRLAQMPKHQQAAFHRGRADHKPYEDTEWQANAFASALLMPALGMQKLERAHDRLTPALLTRHFRVSQEAAGYRITLYENRRGELLT